MWGGVGWLWKLGATTVDRATGRQRESESLLSMSQQQLLVRKYYSVQISPHLNLMPNSVDTMIEYCNWTQN
jgi:hypothetical protein